MDLCLKSKVCLITGASAGSGWATAKYLANEGATIAITARRADRLEALASEIESDTGQKAMITTGDIMNPDDIKSVVADVTRHFGKIDVLVNCAGGSRPVSKDDPESIWVEAMDLNFHSARRFAEAVLPTMKANGWGRIINFSGSMEPRFRNAATSAKAAIHLWSKGLACEVAPFGITVNSIAPGRIKSEQILEKLYPTEESRKDFIEKNIPIGYFGEAEDIAAAVAFLVSEPAGYITGIVLPVDGGMHYFAH